MEDPEYRHRSLLEGEGIRLQNKCGTSVLKNYIGITENHIHFLPDAVYIDVGGRWQTLFSQ